MKAKRRTADGRFARDTQGTAAETIAAATVAAGLVIGAAEHLSPAVAVAQQAQRSDTARTGTADHVAPHSGPAETAHAVAPAMTELAADAAASHAPSSDSPATTPEKIALDTAPHMLGHLPDAAAETAHAVPYSETGTALAPAPQSVHVTLSSAADSISSAMKTLIDHVEGLKGEMPGLATLQQQFDGLAENASHLAQEIASASGATAHAIDLSELLGGPALQAVPHATDLVADQLPPSLLGAEIPSAISGLVPTVGTPEPQLAVTDLAHDPGTVVSDVAPLQLGFLGQSYTDSGDTHDFGSHGLVSPLHGFI
jgi:hypothetical protein